MKKTGKGRAITLGTSMVNIWKGSLSMPSLPEQTPFKPLKVERHPEQDRIDAFMAIPRYVPK